MSILNTLPRRGKGQTEVTGVYYKSVSGGSASSGWCCKKTMKRSWNFDFAPSSMLQNLLSMLLTRHKVEEGTPFFLYLLSTLKKFIIFVAKSRFLRYISKKALKMEREWN